MKYAFIEMAEAIRDFLETGGPVLLAILATAFLMWVLIIERYWFIRITYPRLMKEAIRDWNERRDHHSWYARRIRDELISRIWVQLHKGLILLRTLVALCPLMGLLGTVFGMVQVFDIMAITGTGNARLMASGISMATIPTMAGMVVALSGLYFGARLKFHADHLAQLAADRLHISDIKREACP
ncbi:MAG TPA: MotA/TolQ/ExbB proton channel family protein [Chromatiaceae bacterium]|nr:MotA/TolQ/ExbB proton channel family protein [Chromatiaceae bacterium]